MLTSMILGPAMDIMRNPKAGRAWERLVVFALQTRNFAESLLVGDLSLTWLVKERIRVSLVSKVLAQWHVPNISF